MLSERCSVLSQIGKTIYCNSQCVLTLSNAVGKKPVHSAWPGISSEHSVTGHFGGTSFNIPRNSTSLHII